MDQTNAVTVPRDVEITQRGDASATPLPDHARPKAAHPDQPLEALRMFRRLAAPFRFRVCRDAEGWPVIPGKFGSIEYCDGVVLAVHTDRPRLFARLFAIPGIRRWQVGDQEVRGLFHVEALSLVAGLIRARTRRRPETAAHLQKRPDAPYNVTSAA